MRKQTKSFVVADPAAVGAPTASIEHLIDRSGDLKGELVAFAQTPRFSKQLKAQLRSATGRDGHLDEHTAVLTIDHFAMQHPLPDGRRILERFVAQRRPPLSDDDREMLLGWRNVVDGCFEVCRLDHSAVVIHNLVDDLTYRAHSNMGRRAFTQLRKGMFVIGRIVPVHPATDAWLVSGHFAAFSKSAGQQIAQTALQTLTAHPELLRRNSDMMRRAWELQAEDRADFVALFGSDLVVLPPDEAQAKLQEHYRRRQQKVVADRKGKAHRACRGYWARPRGHGSTARGSTGVRRHRAGL